MKKLFYVLLATLIPFSSLLAVTLKFAVIAPEGTTWAQNLKMTVDEINQATKGRVKFKVYYGGTQGDEPDVLRKVRVGHLQGGIFTGKTLGEINGDVRVMEVPFTFFDQREKAWKTLEKLTPFFNQRFEQNDFVNLGFFEVGLIYLLSKKEVKNLDELKGLKIWSWEGDQVALSFIKYLEMIPVPLASTDVLSSLSTGIIEATYGPPVGFVAMQWHTNANYLVNFPVTYSMGAFLVDKKSWNKVSVDDQKIVKDICLKNLAQINQANINDNRDSFDILKQTGISFIDFSEKDKKKVGTIRQEIIKILQGKVFSAEAIKRLEEARK